MGGGIWLIAWGVSGDYWNRFILGFGGGLCCFVVGGYVLVDFVLRIAS
jgi:hypothetical protein